MRAAFRLGFWPDVSVPREQAIDTIKSDGVFIPTLLRHRRRHWRNLCQLDNRAKEQIQGLSSADNPTRSFVRGKTCSDGV